ncbi:MAG: class I SAM-dependent methyltransferase [Deltaproteobacteria bacterium]|nr:class I SAM-dependent methyltransferase [Deltaproteobacteria bacterium]
MFGGAPYEIKFCAFCGLGKTEPFLYEAKLKKIYSSTYREDDSTRFPKPLERLIRTVRVQRCRRVERFANKGRILDVGCGRADFLSLMAERGWEAYGLELDERIKSRGKSHGGVDLRYGSLHDVVFPDAYFDAVTLWHVFEHIKDPVWAVNECRRILKPGGLLVIAIPNTASVQARLTGRNWFHLDPPFHLYHYTAGNIKALLAKSAFKIETVKNFSLEYNPYGFLQSIFNAAGFRTNLFYDFLRSKHDRGLKTLISLMLMFLMMPVALPVSVILSVAEAVLGLGGTIEVYTKKG